MQFGFDQLFFALKVFIWMYRLLTSGFLLFLGTLEVAGTTTSWTIGMQTPVMEAGPSPGIWICTFEDLP